MSFWHRSLRKNFSPDLPSSFWENFLQKGLFPRLPPRQNPGNYRNHHNRRPADSFRNPAESLKFSQSHAALLGDNGIFRLYQSLIHLVRTLIAVRLMLGGSFEYDLVESRRTDGLILEGGGTASFICIIATLTGYSPSNGTFPVSISYSTIPSE